MVIKETTQQFDLGAKQGLIGHDIYIGKKDIQDIQ